VPSEFGDGGTEAARTYRQVRRSTVTELLLLSDATLTDGRRADVHIADGRIVDAPPAGARRMELAGALLISP
jgi:hypothetical protein